MSHSTGVVKFEDGQIFYFEYNGTSDVCLPFLYETYEELHANWRRRDWKLHKCELEPENVVIYSTYGGGFYWNGRACRKCMLLTHNLSLETFDYESAGMKDGRPEWSPFDWDKR